MRIALLLALAACGSGSTVSDGGPDATSDGIAMDDASDSGMPPPKMTGQVIVSSTNAMMMRYDAFGLFAATPMSGQACPATFMEGACEFFDCPTVASGDAGTPSYLGAGNVGVTVGMTDIPLFKMADGEYRAQGTMPLYDGGEMVQAHATGDPMGAPAFMLSIAAASRITVTNPIYPTVVSLPVPESQPLQFTWTGGTTGGVHVSLTTYPTGRTNTILCQVTASAGTLTIGSSLLQKMAKGPGEVGVAVTSEVTMVQGDWGLTLSTYNTAVDPNGKALTLVGADVL